MPPSRWAVSLLIVCHLTAIGLGAFPKPSTTTNPAPIGLLDEIASLMSAATTSVLINTLTPAAQEYLGLTGLAQPWNMFAPPPEDHEYVRIRYYVGSGETARWTATELVLPAHREDRVRLWQSFRDSYQDKAVATAVRSFNVHLSRDSARPGAASKPVPDDLAPVARYFARRFQQRHLGAGERVVRIEVWVGSAPMPRVGDKEAAAALRLATLRGYYDGPVENRLRPPSYPPREAAEEEGGIEWILEYFEGA